MPETLVVFDAQLTSADGRRWSAQACGGIAEDTLWEGWIEFLPLGADAPPVRTPRETEQPNRDDLMYWAQGLSAIYLDGALERAIRAPSASASRSSAAQPAFGAPARADHKSGISSIPRAILNPFSVYQEGEDILIAQLGALDTPRLRELAIAYGFAPRTEGADAGRERLTALIVAGARGGISQPTNEMRRERR
jgi:hypothetical protein